MMLAPALRLSRRRPYRLLTPAALACAFTMTSAGMGLANEQAQSAPPVPARIVSPESGVARSVFTTAGRVVAADDVMLTVEAPGRVAKVLVADAARVEAEQPMLRLVDDDERASRDAAEARVARAEADLERARALFEEDVAAEARVETARANARAARAALASAEAALADLTLRAPFAGAVGFVDVSPGTYLRPGDAVARLTAIDDLRVRFGLPQRLAERATPGTRVMVRRDGADCGEAEIVALSPAMRGDTRSREVEARAPSGCGLRDGGFTSVSLTVSSRENALFAPQAAIRREGFEAWVFVVEETADGLVARRRAVTLGVVESDRVEIRDGIVADARLVGDGAARVTDGARLRPVEGDGA